MAWNVKIHDKKNLLPWAIFLSCIFTFQAILSIFIFADSAKFWSKIAESAKIKILKMAWNVKIHDKKIAHGSKFFYHVFLRFRPFWVVLFLLIQQSFWSKIAESAKIKILKMAWNVKIHDKKICCREHFFIMYFYVSGHFEYFYFCWFSNFRPKHLLNQQK